MVRQQKNSIKNALVVTGLTALCIVTIGAISLSTTSAVSIEENNTNTNNDVIKHLSNERGISLEEAKKRIEWQDRASTLNDRLIAKLPRDDFGGVWINKSNDRVQLGVLNGSIQDGANRHLVNQEVSDSSLEGAVDFINVDNPYSELKAAKDWISKDAQERLTKNDWPIQVGITTDTNQVMIHIPEDPSKLSEAQAGLLTDIEARYGDMVRRKTYTKPAQNEACNWWFCDSPLRGAVGIKGDVNGYEDGINCTLGFNVVGNSGTRYALTAGHCGPFGNGWATEQTNFVTKKIGPIHRNEYGQNGTDAMIIKIKEDTYNWTVRGWVYVRSGVGWNGFSGPSENQEYDITEAGTSGSLVGQRVCVSGSISSAFEGGSCGAVHEVDISITVGGITTHDVVRAGYCSRARDSGSPVFREGKALGIHTAADTTAGTCSNEKYYTGIVPIIHAMDDTISIF